jgi:hypothetical protein
VEKGIAEHRFSVALGRYTWLSLRAPRGQLDGVCTGSRSNGRAVSHKHVRVDLEGASLLFSPGTAESVNRPADYDIHKSAISEDLLTARTGRPTGNSPGL